MIRLTLIFVPTGLGLGWATDVYGAGPLLIVCAFVGAVVLAVVGVKLFERAGV